MLDYLYSCSTTRWICCIMMFLRHRSSPLNCKNEFKTNQRKSKEIFLIIFCTAHNRFPQKSYSTFFARKHLQKSHPSIAEQLSTHSVIPHFFARKNVKGSSNFPPPVTAQRFPPPVIPQHFLSSCHSGLFFYLSLRPPSRSPGQH